MNRDQLVSEFQALQSNFHSVVKLLREIGQFDKNREENIRKIEQTLSKLSKTAGALANSLGKSEIHVNNLMEWMDRYKSEIEKTREEVKKHFGTGLEDRLKELNFSLTGQYPELRAGLFTIELDFEQWRATLWYGPKQEKLDSCSLSIIEIAKRIEKARSELGSKIPEKELLEKLYHAYKRAVHTYGEEAPIIKVLAEMAYLLQSQRFLQDPKREHFKSYSRADFSFDLFRIQQFQRNITPPTVHLKTATRAFTKRRSDFLWIPQGESGKGTVYSHLRFEEKPNEGDQPTKR